jgi:predicted aldo/keto reductase-like oxidoreductase
MKNNYSNLREIKRRRFLKMAAVLTTMAYLPSCSTRKAGSDKWGYVLPKRKLGKTGLDVTMFCLGGGPANINMDQEEAIVEAAFKGGCRFFETARSYGTEPAFGNILAPYRNEIILSSKSRALNAETLTRELDQSLETLKTGYLDIYLMHNVSTLEYRKRKFDGGVWDAMLKAKQEGKVRHLGFSGHSDYNTNNYMLNMNLPDLEVMLLPVNVIDTINNSFTLNTLPLASEKNIGVMAMKPIGGGGMVGADITWGLGRGNKRPRVIPDVISMREAQHFVYSMPISAASFGCTSLEHVEEDITLAKSFTGLNKEEQENLIERVTQIAQNNLLEHYKGDGIV